jgi:hypothetical protein
MDGFLIHELVISGKIIILRWILQSWACNFRQNYRYNSSNDELVIPGGKSVPPVYSLPISWKFPQKPLFPILPLTATSAVIWALVVAVRGRNSTLKVLRILTNPGSVTLKDI